MRRLILIALLTGAIVSPCAYAGPGGGHDHDHGPQLATGGGEGGPVTLSDEAIALLGVKTFHLELAPFRTTIDVFGEVVPAPNHAAELTAPAAGTVQLISVLEGERVEAGQALAVIAPFQIGAKPLTLAAPIAGVVTGISVLRGSGVQPGDPLLEIADTRHLLFRAHLHSPLIARELTAGIEAEVRFHAMGDEGIHGKLVGIAPKSDEPGHYGEALIALEGDTRGLALGVRGTASIVTGDGAPALVIPEPALLGEMGRVFAYVRKGNTFEPRRLALGRRNAHWVEVVSGLEPGDRVVVHGQYQLQFASSDEPADGAAHDHAHDAHEHPHDHEHAPHPANAHEHEHEEHDHSHPHGGNEQPHHDHP